MGLQTMIGFCNATSPAYNASPLPPKIMPLGATPWRGTTRRAA